MSNIERNLLITLLSLTTNGSVSHKLVNSEARISSELAQGLIEKLENEGIIQVRRGFIEADSFNRLRLAVRAISLGADPEYVSKALQWKEFEGIAATTLEKNDYAVHRNLRFKHSGRRFEIDIIACKKPIVLSIDCKHWHRQIYPSALRTIVGEQVERTNALAKCLPNPMIKMECCSWDKAKMVPAVLSLVVGDIKFLDDVPIVPILQFQDFLSQLPLQVDSLKHFSMMAYDFQDRFSRKP